MVGRALRGIRATAACLVIAAALLVQACGGEEPPPDRVAVRALLMDAMKAFEERDEMAICDVLSRRGKQVVGSAVHTSPPYNCPIKLRFYFRAMDPYLGADRKELPRIERVALPGSDRAVLTLRVPGGSRVTARARREDGDWKLDGIFDATWSRVQARGLPAVERLVAPVDRPPAATTPRAVTVRDSGTRTRCPSMTTARFPSVGGGCVLSHMRGWVDLVILTPFGYLRLGHCEAQSIIRVDGDGRAWIADFVVRGPSPCLDVIPCWTQPRTRTPWRARIDRVAGDRQVLRIPEVCLDTCIGRFTGAWELELVDRGDSWRMDSASTVGTSGWIFDGALASRGRRIEIGTVNQRVRPLSEERNG